MTDGFYIVWDSVRDRMPHEIVADSDETAIKEFCSWYNVLVPVSRWEKRRSARYFLAKCGLIVDGVKRHFVCPTIVMEDWEVALDEIRFRMSDPPTDAAEEAENEVEYARLCKLDAERREKMAQFKLRRRVEDEVLEL